MALDQKILFDIIDAVVSGLGPVRMNIAPSLASSSFVRGVCLQQVIFINEYLCYVQVFPSLSLGPARF